jgi:hypothetical protein
MWIESPLQLLCAIEAHRHGLTEGRAVATMRVGMPGLAATLTESISMGLPPGLTIAAPEPRPNPGPAARLVLGDAFSGAMHQRLILDDLSERMTKSRRLPHELIIVDDGLATVHLLGLLTRHTPAPLTRARARAGVARRVIGGRLWGLIRRIADDGGVTTFTAMPVAPDLADACRDAGIRVVHNDFEWLRSAPGCIAPTEQTIVLGTSLVANGLIDGVRYWEWLDQLADTGPVAYHPHRREEPAFLDRIQADPRFRVSHSSAAAELTLRGLDSRHTVWSLPSTALVTLNRIVGPRGATMRALTVPDTWWTLQAPVQVRSHLVSLSRLSQPSQIVQAPAPQGATS